MKWYHSCYGVADQLSEWCDRVTGSGTCHRLRRVLVATPQAGNAAPADALACRRRRRWPACQHSQHACRAACSVEMREEALYSRREIVRRCDLVLCAYLSLSQLLGKGGWSAQNPVNCVCQRKSSNPYKTQLDAARYDEAWCTTCRRGRSVACAHVLGKGAQKAQQLGLAGDARLQRSLLLVQGTLPGVVLRLKPRCLRVTITVLRAARLQHASAYGMPMLCDYFSSLGRLAVNTTTMCAGRWTKHQTKGLNPATQRSGQKMCDTLAAE